MREKEAALESVNKLKGLIEKADLQSVKGHLIHYAEFEDMYPRIMDEPAPIVMLQVAAELCNHLENIDTIVSLLRDETKGPILKPTLSHNQH